MTRLGAFTIAFLASSLVPWLFMASFFALTQTNPRVIEAPLLTELLALEPTWHNVATAFLNQSRLGAASFGIAFLCALFVAAINPIRRKAISICVLVAVLIAAIVANGIDCMFSFRSSELAMIQTLIRSIPWFSIGVVFWWMAEYESKL